MSCRRMIRCHLRLYGDSEVSVAPRPHGLYGDSEVSVGASTCKHARAHTQTHTHTCPQARKRAPARGRHAISRRRETGVRSLRQCRPGSALYGHITLASAELGPCRTAVCDSHREETSLVLSSQAHTPARLGAVTYSIS